MECRNPDFKIVLEDILNWLYEAGTVTLKEVGDRAWTQP